MMKLIHSHPFRSIESIHSFTPCLAKIDSSGHEWSLYRMNGIHSRTLASCSDTCTLTQVHHPLSELELILIPLAKLNSFISRKGGLIAIIDLWSVWLHSNGKVMAWCRSCCCWRCFGFWIFAKNVFWPGMWRGRIWDARRWPVLATLWTHGRFPDPCLSLVETRDRNIQMSKSFMLLALLRTRCVQRRRRYNVSLGSFFGLWAGVWGGRVTQKNHDRSMAASFFQFSSYTCSSKLCARSSM